MNESAAKVLLIGYGNPGRGDDGLGPALAEAMGALNLPGLTVDADYQLVAEDALSAANHEVVVFVDADTKGPEPFSFRELAPKSELSFSSHSLSPAAVLAMAAELFGAHPRGFLLGVRGYAFNEFNEALSEKARANLGAASDFLAAWLDKNSFRIAENNEPLAPFEFKEEK